MRKNWAWIAKTNSADARLSFSMLDLESEYGRILSKHIPDLSIQEPEVQTPISLKFLQTEALKCKHQESGEHDRDILTKLFHMGVIPQNIPVVGFTTSSRISREDKKWVVAMPLDLIELLKKPLYIGSVLDWQKFIMMLIEVSESERGMEFYFVPAECIECDVPVKIPIERCFLL